VIALGTVESHQLAFYNRKNLFPGHTWCQVSGIQVVRQVTSVIVNTTRITVRPENRNELFQTIRPLLDPIRSEKGCLAFRFYVDAADENSSVLIGEWETREDWSKHLESRDFAVLLGAITVLSSPSSIDFKLLSAVPVTETNVFTTVQQ
jgi:quinol monooxygenase YgiN